MKLLSASSAILLLAGAMSEDCPPELTQSMILNTNSGNTLLFKYDVILSSFSDSMSVLCAQLESDAGGYIVFGTSPSGTMEDGEAIIGIPDDAAGDHGTVRKYYLNMDYPRTVMMPEDHQTLWGPQIIKENGATIMAFSKKLREVGERTIMANGENTFLWALGGDSDLSSFPDDGVGTFNLDFGITRSPTSSTVTPPPSMGDIDVPEGRDRTLSPTGGYIRREEPETSLPAPAPNTDMPVSSPSEAAMTAAPASATMTTETSTQDAATPNTVGTPSSDTAATPQSGAMIRKIIGKNVIFGLAVALWFGM